MQNGSSFLEEGEFAFQRDSRFRRVQDVLTFSDRATSDRSTAIVNSYYARGLQVGGPYTNVKAHLQWQREEFVTTDAWLEFGYTERCCHYSYDDSL